jgi:hypothetical protein
MKKEKFLTLDTFRDFVNDPDFIESNMIYEITFVFDPKKFKRNNITTNPTSLTSSRAFLIIDKAIPNGGFVIITSNLFLHSYYYSSMIFNNFIDFI